MTVEARTSVVFGRMDRDDAHTLDGYLATDGYAGLRRALTMAPDAVQQTIATSQLTGRGGAGFGSPWPRARGARDAAANAATAQSAACRRITAPPPCRGDPCRP